MERIWKDIAGFEGLYQVSNYGEVKALERLVENNGGLQKKHERILKQNRSNKTHCTVVLCKDGKMYPKLVHRLVALAFIPNPENKPVVDHIDTNPQNNRVDNLRWVTTQENCMNPITRINNSKSKMGHQYYGRPLTVDERKKISDANKGKKYDDDMKRKLSDAHKNSDIAKMSSLKNLEKARAAKIGKTCTDETKNKIRQKLIGVHKGKSWKVIDGKRVWFEKGE